MVSTIILLPLLKDDDAVLESIQDNHGNTWSRRPDESQQAFEARASSETPRKTNQVVMMIGKVVHTEESCT